MILRLRAQILEDSLLPIPLHVIPVIDHPMSNWIVDTVAWGFSIRERLVSNEEIEIFYSSFGCEMTWF